MALKDTINAANKNCSVTLYTKGTDNKTKTLLFGPIVNSYIGPPMGPQGIADWTMLGIDVSGNSAPSDCIVFNVPETQTNLELNSERNIVLVITGGDNQQNGTYTLLGRAAKTKAKGFNIQFRCYVQKQRTI